MLDMEYYNMSSELVAHKSILRSLSKVSAAASGGKVINLSRSIEILDQAINNSDYGLMNFFQMIKESLLLLDQKPVSPESMKKLNDIISSYQRLVYATIITEGLSGDDILYLSDILAKPNIKMLLSRIHNNDQLTNKDKGNLISLQSFDLATITGNRIALTKKGSYLLTMLEEI
jgi:hypothetical protein